MCGIAGWVGPWCEPEQMTKMTDAMSHRGPDGEGQEQFRLDETFNVALGHRRLSIIDLAAGQQPMFSHDRRYCITFNGEIYNYVELRDQLAAAGAKFLTHSDTEVIIEAWRIWGPECLLRFRGMFAFALYDTLTQRLELARDPFGKKPLYYSQGEASGRATLRFASQITALVGPGGLRPEIDPEAVYNFLLWRYVPGPGTLLRGIFKLPPGSRLTWERGQMAIRRYWTAPYEGQIEPQIGTEDALEAVVEVFDEAVRLRMRADVPIGIFLSGGLDSTAILASLHHQGLSDIRSFSVGDVGDPRSEIAAATETAAVFGTRHSNVAFDRRDILDLLPRLSFTRGAPVTEPADLPIFVMSREAARQVKVVLSGEGSDELFAGYPKHRMENMQLLRAIPRAAWGLASGAIAHLPFGRSDLGRRIEIFMRAQREPLAEDRMVAWFAAMSAADRDRLWRVARPEPYMDRRPFEPREGVSALQRTLHFDQTSWLPDNLLERMDSMTMAASIEARTPFMDVRLASLSGRLPGSRMIDRGITKQIVRQAFAGRIPDAVLKRPKNGFQLPVAEWFREELREPFSDLVLAAGSRLSEFVDIGELGLRFADHLAGRRDHSKMLWSVFALEVFLREMSEAGTLGSA